MLTGASRGRVLAEKGTWENFCGDEMFEMFYTMSVVLVTQLYTFIKTQTFHLNWLSFIVFKLYNAINLIKFFSTGEVEENHHSFFFFFIRERQFYSIVILSKFFKHQDWRERAFIFFGLQIGGGERDGQEQKCKKNVKSLNAKKK